MDSIKLIAPIQSRLNEIEESLYKKQISQIGDERMIYGTFEKNYHDFYLKSLRNDIVVTQNDFLSEKLNELHEIEKGVIAIERKFSNELKQVQYHGILSKIFKLKSFIAELLQSNITYVDRKKIIKKAEFLSYDWRGRNDQINTLYKLLKGDKIISSQTKYNDFEIVFKICNLSDIKNPIIWMSSNASELLYFIISLIKIELVSGNIKRLNYDVIKSCFVQENGGKFSVEFKSLKTDIEIKLSLDRQKRIDKIIQQITK